MSKVRTILLWLVPAMMILAVWPATSRAASSVTDVRPTYSVTISLTAPANAAVVTQGAITTATASVTGTNPGMQRAIFGMDGGYLLTDYQAPYTFILPTDHFLDGPHTISVQFLMRDGYTTSAASITVYFSNGVLVAPVNTHSFSPSIGSTPPPGQPFVVAASGDGAGGETNAGLVANLIGSMSPNLLLYLGDVYEKGSYAEFSNWYGTGGSFFSRFRSITDPVVGNHEYGSTGANGYFFYWDNIPHYYSYNAGAWHFVALDSTTQFNQYAAGKAQYNWLSQDLTAHKNQPTIVYFHHPRYSVGPEGDTAYMQSIWQLMYTDGVDIVLNGHDHSYQRWMPMDGSGNATSSGMTEFVVGTAGHSIQKFARTDSRLAAGDDTAATARGALFLKLSSSGASYQYVNTAGTVLDSGTIPVSGSSGPDTTAPSTPTGLVASATSSSRVDLSWTASTDNVGVAGYTVYRGGVAIATTGPGTTTYSDTLVSAGTTYAYQVQAFDGATPANVSQLSATATVTTPSASAALFSDGFESGMLSAWTSVTGSFTAQSGAAHTGSWAAHAVGTGTAAYASYTLPQPAGDLYYDLWFKETSQAANTVYLARVRTAANASILGVYLSSTGKLSYRNDVAAVSTTSTVTPTLGVWHELQVRVSTSSGQVATWFDGVPVAALTKSEALGATPIGRLQLGENATGRTFDVSFDDVTASTSFVN